MKTFVPLLALALAGCAAMSTGREYGTAGRKPTAHIETTLPSGRTKAWRIYEHPTDRTRLLIMEGAGATFGKNLIPIVPLFADMSAAPARFDEAADAYLQRYRPGCVVVRSTEIADLNAYEFRIRCEAAAQKAP